MSQSIFCSSSLLTQVGCLLYVDGSIYASNFGTPTGSIVKIDLDGNATLIYKASAGIYFSTMVYVNGYFYITDDSSKIYKMDITGQNFTPLVTFNTTYNQGLGITYYDGFLYSCNSPTVTENSVVFKVNITTGASTTFITSSSFYIQLSYITVDNNGNFYITSTSSILKYNNTGTLLSTFISVGGFSGIYLYNNHFYITKENENKIYQYDISGNLITNRYANGGNTYSSSGGMVFDNSGKFYVSNDSGRIIQTIQNIVSLPAITTFTDSLTVDENVFVTFSGFFKPTQTGYWTFNLGTAIQSSDDLAILFLGPDGTFQITPASTLSTLSTTLSNTTPILFNNYWQYNPAPTDPTYIYSTTMYLTAGLYYPLLLYFSQYAGDYNCKFSFFYGNYQSAVTTNLKAYLHLNNSNIESVSNIPSTDVTDITYRNYLGRTGVYYGSSGSTYSATATNFIQNVSIPSLSLIAANGVSISLWFYPTTTTYTSSILISITDNVSTWNGGGFIVLLTASPTTNTSSINFTFANYQTISGSNTGYASGYTKSGINITNNTWYHLVVTFDGSGSTKYAKIYLNNVDQNATSNGVNSNGIVSSLNITADSNLVSIGTSNTKSSGAGYNGNNFPNFTGVISQVGIYNSVLTSADVNSLYAYTFAPSPNIITDLTEYIFDPIPNPPTNISIIISSSKLVTITYTNPIITGGSDVFTNFAYFSTSATMSPLSFNGVGIDIGNDNTYENTNPDLINGETYYVAIKTQNTAGYFSEYSNVSEGFFISGGVPDPPTINSINISGKNFTVSYTNSTNTGGSAIIKNYAYFSNIPNMSPIAFDAVDIANTNSYENIINGLIDTFTYYVALKSENAAGNFSEYSAISQGFVITDIPNAPTINSLNITGKFLTISYSNSTVVGGSAIVRNYVYFSNNADMGTVSGVPLNISTGGNYENNIGNLIDGLTYYVALKSENAAGNFSEYSAISQGFFISDSITAPIITSITITPSTKKVDLSYNNTSTGIQANYLYLSTSSNTATIADISLSVGITGSYSDIVNGILYGRVYYVTMTSQTTIYTSPFSTVYGPFTMLTMSIPGLQWTSYTNSSNTYNVNIPYAAVTLGATSNSIYAAIVNYFTINSTIITSGKTTSLQTCNNPSLANPSITTFTNSVSSTEYVGVKFSGFFIPNQTGSWTFSIGSPNDGAIVYLGLAGTTTITPATTFTSFSTTPNSSNPILYNYYSFPPGTGTVKGSGSYDLSKNLCYPILIYYLQYSGNYDIRFSVTSPSPSSTVITDFSSSIFNPLPETPILNNVIITPSTKKVELFYKGSTFNGGYNIITNTAYFSTNSNMNTPFNVDFGNSDTSGNAIVTSLVYGNSYYVAMKSLTDIGYSSYSNILGSFLIATVPVAPVLDSATIGSDKTVTLNYTISTFDTGSAISTNYVFFSTSPSIDLVSDISININNITPYISTVDSLEFDVSYTVAIKSLNAIGYSAYSNIKGPFRITNSSGAPFIRSITSGDGNLTVSFNTPNPGIGSTISGYQYGIDTEASYLPTNSFFGNATTTSFIITKVANTLILGREYTIFLRAVTTVIGSDALVFGSSSSKIAIPYTVPTSPSSVSISIDSTDFSKINVTYTLVSNGGSAYTGYGYSINGGGYFDITTTTLGSFSIYGNYGSAYYVNVKLKNAAGFSDPSPQSTTITLSNVPDAPIIYSATVGDVGGSILLTYDIPNGNGSPINNYDYYVYESTVTPLANPTYILINSTNTSYRITGLTNGTAYFVKLRARNTTGPSLPTTLASAVTPYTTPNAISVVNATVTASSTTIAVSWTTPANNGNAITAYSYSINTDSFIEVISTLNSFNIPSRIYGTSYIINVKVKNAAEYSNPTASTAVIPYTVPGKPGFTPSVGNRQISLLITAPATNGRPITDYEYAIYLTSSIPGTDTFITTGGNGNITSFLINKINTQDLVNGTNYTIRLRAKNLAGVGAHETGTATPQPTPLAPNINSTSFGDGFITLNFTPNAADAIIVTGPGVIDFYEYNINGSATYISTGSTSLTYTIRGLTNGTPYIIGLKAHSSIGSGIAASTASIIPYTTPSIPIINTINLANETIILNITAPYDGGNAIKRYEYSTNGGSYISTGGNGTTITIPNLINKTTYTINLRAFNDAGYSPVATTTAAPYYASINGTISGSSLTLSGYINNLNGLEVPNYYINQFNKINNIIGTVNYIVVDIVDYVSLYASYIIASGTGFTINSDQRIKKNVDYLSSVKSLELVNALKPCSFQYVDVMKGTGVKYGYLAQEVETVFPTMVYTNSEYIPNIYEMVRIEDSGKVWLNEKNTDMDTFTIGTKLKFYDIQNTVILREVHEIIDAKSFTVTEVFPEGMNTLFLYGQEVPNLRSIDAKQMTSVLLSALQEINKIIEEQDNEIDELMKMAEVLRKELDGYI